MKYLNYIFLMIMMMVLVGIAVNHYTADKASEAGYITINNRHYALDEVKKRLNQHPYYLSEGNEAFIDRMVDTELLIQEAQRVRIDKEPAFKEAVQDFVEQSLVQILMKRKYEELDTEISDDEVRQYQSQVGRNYQMKLITYDNDQIAASEKNGVERVISENFEDLPYVVQNQILKNNDSYEISPVFLYKGAAVRIKVDKIVESVAKESRTSSDEMVRFRLEKEKKTLAMESWLEELRDNADIQLPASFKELD